MSRGGGLSLVVATVVTTIVATATVITPVVPTVLAVVTPVVTVVAAVTVVRSVAAVVPTSLVNDAPARQERGKAKDHGHGSACQTLHVTTSGPSLSNPCAT
jgi:hypothetical protein